MIIAQIAGGLGNQLFMYAVGRCLAHRLNAEFKLDMSSCPADENSHSRYRLFEFNIAENLASGEEIESVKASNCVEEPSHLHKDIGYMPEVLNAPDDTYTRGYFQSEKYFIEIEDIIRREFTLKDFEGEHSRHWLEKIQGAECAVSLHIRHGDYTSLGLLGLFGVMPVKYYYDCVEELKKISPQITLFVFSDDINWAKRNLLFDVPTEFVEGCERDCDEMFLMSQCRHNIIANSTFSWWGAWLNPNPDKKVFAPARWLRKHCVNRDVLPDAWIKMPVDYSRYPNFNLNHDVSIIVYVNNDFNPTAQCLANVLTQNVNNYEVIIIDDASTDASSVICRREAEQRDNVRLVRMTRKIGRANAYNLAVDMARNEYIIFLDNNNRIVINAIEYLQNVAGMYEANIFHGINRLEENADGDMVLAGKKFSVRTDEAFDSMKIHGGGGCGNIKCISNVGYHFEQTDEHIARAEHV